MIPMWLSIFGLVLGGLGTLGASIAILRSRYRERTDLEREKYITALEERNKFLEEDKQRRDKDQAQLRDKIAQLEGKVQMLQDMILHQCPMAEIDPVTGGCRFCAKGMAYGQGGR